MNLLTGGSPAAGTSLESSPIEGALACGSIEVDLLERGEGK